MVTYGAQSWGGSIKFRAGRNENECKNKMTVSHLKVDKSDNYSDDFTLSVTDGDLSKHSGTFGDFWDIKKGAKFTVSSSKFKIVHIAISFSSKKGSLWDDTHGAERLKCNSGGTYKKLDSTGGRYGDASWSCPSTTDGYNSVEFEAHGADANILWIRIYYNEINGNATNGDSNGSLTFSGKQYFTGSTQVKLTVTGSYGNVKWTRDNADPKTATISGSNRGNGAFPDGTAIDCSYSYKAVASYTTNAHSIDSEVDDDDNDNFTIYATAERHFYKQYSDTKIGSGGYATFCYEDYCWYVPDNVTAYAYTTTATKKSDAPCYLTVSKSYSTNDIIPAGTAVVLKGTAGAQPTFTNPDMNVGGTKPTSNVLLGNGSDSEATAASYGGGNYVYYYLMQERQGGQWGFFWGAPNGAAVALGGHKAYLRLSTLGSAAKGFIMQMPDDDNGTTGIVAIPVSDTETARDLDPSIPMYNTAGQRVGSNYKGIVIQNGRKFLKR